MNTKMEMQISNFLHKIELKLAQLSSGKRYGVVLLGTMVGIDQFLNLHEVKQNMEIYTGRLRVDLVPFARASGGNLLAFDLKNGEIIYWDHELETANPETDQSNETAIAKNIELFFELINAVPALDLDANSEVKIREIKKSPNFDKKFNPK